VAGPWHCHRGDGASLIVGRQQGNTSRSNTGAAPPAAAARGLWRNGTVTPLSLLFCFGFGLISCMFVFLILTASWLSGAPCSACLRGWRWVPASSQVTSAVSGSACLPVWLPAGEGSWYGACFPPLFFVIFLFDTQKREELALPVADSLEVLCFLTHLFFIYLFILLSIRPWFIQT